MMSSFKVMNAVVVQIHFPLQMWSVWTVLFSFVQNVQHRHAKMGYFLLVFRLHITKTRLFKYTEHFNTKKWQFFHKKKF